MTVVAAESTRCPHVAVRFFVAVFSTQFVYRSVPLLFRVNGTDENVYFSILEIGRGPYSIRAVPLSNLYVVIRLSEYASLV